MARTDNKPETKEPIAPDAVEAAKAVPVVDTTVLDPNAEPDPRGENRPGVLPDTYQPEIDPITNLRRDQLDEGGRPLPNANQAPVRNPAPADVPSTEDAKKPRGRKVRMRATSDIWPSNRPKDWPDDKEYRVHAGEEVDLPEEEAWKFANAGCAVKVDKLG